MTNIEELKQKAESSDAKDLYAYGKALLEDPTQDAEEALANLMLAYYYMGHADAAILAGDCAFFGVGTDVSLQEAINRYSFAAQRKGIKATPNLQAAMERFCDKANRLNIIDKYIEKLFVNFTSVRHILTGNYNCYNDDYRMLLGESEVWAEHGNFPITILDRMMSRESTVRCLNSVILSMLLQVPIKKMKLNIVDLGMTNDARYLTMNLHPSLYHNKVIVDEHQLRERMLQLRDLSAAQMQRCGDVAEFNDGAGTVEIPYEVVVFLDYDADADYSKYVDPLLENNGKGGVYFVMVESSPSHPLRLVIEPDENLKMLDTDLVFPFPLDKNPELEQKLFAKINEKATAKDELKVLKQDLNSIAKRQFEDTTALIEATVGNDGSSDIRFSLDAESHVHAFVLGQSGSGKSVFLHNVIINAMARYAPEDLQFYLLDFKLGGVEFNRYRESKHVKALLVDNSDYQITLEILRDLSESMKERGVLLRNAGVSNIKDYNTMHPSNRMPQIVLVADECHVMFSQSDDVPVRARREMAEVISKIAKEGRSQGVHLLLATQTLAGAEISNEILNNITDHYLLKCSATDSNRMVDGSSDVTGGLNTGQVYYHGRSEQAKFQSFFAAKDELEGAIGLINEKTAQHTSNGQFYFSGAQTFAITERVAEEMGTKGRRSIVGSAGCTITLNRTNVTFPLKTDFSENVLLFGINDKYQVTRTAMNVFATLMLSNARKSKDYEFCVIDCLDEDDEDAVYLDLLDDLLKYKLCREVRKRERGSFLQSLANDIKSGNNKETILLILGQERFREVKLGMELEQEPAPTTGGLDFGADPFATSAPASTFRTYTDVLLYILNKGPEAGVHTLMQIDKPASINFVDYVSAKSVFTIFKHLIMLRSDERAAVTLQLDDNIKLQQLCNEEERLRAYYYDNEKDEYTLFSPYVLPDGKLIKKLITNE